MPRLAFISGCYTICYNGEFVLLMFLGDEYHADHWQPPPNFVGTIV